MIEFLLPVAKNDSQAQMASGLSSSGDTIQLKTSEASLFPTGNKDSATSLGTSSTLNSTGIGSKVSVGDFIRNVTDGSWAWVLTVSINSITTTDLIGGSDDTWQSADEWVVGSFYAWLSKKDASGEDTTRELVLVEYVDSSSDQLHIETRAVEGLAATFSADDYVSVYVSAQYPNELNKAIGELMRRKPEDDEVVHSTGNETVAGEKTFLNKASFVVVPESLADPVGDNDLVRKSFADSQYGGAQKSFIFGESAVAGEAWRFGIELTQGDFSQSTESFFRFNSNIQRFGVFFTTPSGGMDVKSVKVKLKKGGSPTGNITCKIYQSNKTTLVQAADAAFDGSTLSTSFSDVEFLFTSLSLTGSTTYFIEIDSDTTLSTSNYYKYGTIGSGTNHVYNGTWTTDGGNQASALITYGPEDTSKLYKTDASDSALVDFLGFSIATVAADSSGILQMGGLNSFQSGMTQNETMYLSDTPGEIQNSAGSNSVKIGRALSVSDLLIIQPPL